jgi:hypothetical protein
MRVVGRCVAGGCLWLSVVASSALAQVDRIGGPVEFRSADRPIAAPTLRFAEPASPDLEKSLPASPPAPDDVIKQIDKELGKTGARATIGADYGTLGSPEKTDEQSGLGRITFK